MFRKPTCRGVALARPATDVHVSTATTRMARSRPDRGFTSDFKCHRRVCTRLAIPTSSSTANSPPPRRATEYQPLLPLSLRQCLRQRLQLPCDHRTLVVRPQYRRVSSGTQQQRPVPCARPKRDPIRSKVMHQVLAQRIPATSANNGPFVNGLPVVCAFPALPHSKARVKTATQDFRSRRMEAPLLWSRV